MILNDPILLYKKIKVENFESIRNELEQATVDNVAKNFRFWDVPFNWFKDKSPLLYEFIESRKRIPVRLCRFYLTPPLQILKPHVDGLTTNKSPIGLNIPIIGYKNTSMDWYDCADDNLEDGPYGFNKIKASKIINFSKIKKICSTCIDVPTLVRTDIAHGVINSNPYPRLVLSIRFFYGTTFGKNFDDIINLENLE